MASAAHPGTLHEYAPRRVAFEFTSSTPEKQHSLIFIGGLQDGLCTVPYVPALAKALEPTPWSVFQAQLSSSFGGWGTGSLDQDVAEIAQCVEYVRKLQASAAPDGKVVIMGHSTGSQDVLHYLYAANPASRPRPPVHGAILQAPVSDREAMLAETRKPGPAGAEARGAFEQLVAQARLESSADENEILPLGLTRKVGLPGDPISAARFFSLASPDSPAAPAVDDLFSSDLSDERLRETFGVVRTKGLLRSRLLVLYSGSDEYAAPWADKGALMERWRLATEAGQEGAWDGNSAIIAGASHTVKDEGQAELVERVSRYLEGI
ncbi:uncharacterized protein ACLA_038290 [Aspergillus clavatus NRRL 1]|uniref:Uncharacterized protein n=1 Tax=Aspergillus clavatus (strain ATCC 1007 / CBS 513.65 / DSM 816 / NCTC 3887 / NRRL 1 / QM 1276 / 107) TaxID=344612 RepID=A1CKE4_ASPCL|nr:uncharacterized protein ACLA_038290 [Aspergillus clavatus NRRL 1]EAW09618.1 conserved hypothetical protein [Aspergillus clavatus NRRL 1]